MFQKLNRNFVAVLTLSLTVPLTGCLFDSGTLWQDDQYYVSWIDIGENRSVYYRLENGSGIGRIDPTILAVGSNEFFLVAKRFNGLNVGYYYIEKSKDGPYRNPSEVTKGPFTEKEFAALREEFELPLFEKNFD